MLSALRSRLTYTNVAVTIALLFAMTGGAYAAKKYVITSAKQISPSVLKQLQGRAGAAGAPGAAGIQGAQGPVGSAGPGGQAGAKGETGPAGAKGEKGATGSTGAKGATGATGATGMTGFTETLPKGKTETGTWAGTAYNFPPNTEVQIPISFPIPLAASGVAVFLDEEETKAVAGTDGCTGSVAQPTAPAGTLCIYTAEETRTGFFALHVTTVNHSEEEYEPSGTVLRAFHGEQSEESHLQVNGSWAVTAP